MPECAVCLIHGIGGLDERLGETLQPSVTFDFFAPFLPARVTDLNQTVTENGIPITLKSVRVSPAETIMQVITPPTGLSAGITDDGHLFSLTMGNAQVQRDSWNVGYTNIEYNQAAAHELIVTTTVPLFDKQGQWALRISHLAKSGGKTDWVFHFTVPPVQ